MGRNRGIIRKSSHLMGLSRDYSISSERKRCTSKKYSLDYDTEQITIKLFSQNSPSLQIQHTISSIGFVTNYRWSFFELFRLNSFRCSPCLQIYIHQKKTYCYRFSRQFMQAFSSLVSPVRSWRISSFPSSNLNQNDNSWLNFSKSRS